MSKPARLSCLQPRLRPVSDQRLGTAREQSWLRQERRGLKTNSSEWRRIRAQVLADEPLCRHCKAEGRVTLAVDVDHIHNDTRDNDRARLQPLCRSCHSRKTATDMARGIV